MWFPSCSPSYLQLEEGVQESESRRAALPVPGSPLPIQANAQGAIW